MIVHQIFRQLGMVGISDEISGIKKKLVGGVRPCDYGIFWIVGRAGSGRTVTARIILEELLVGKDKCVDCGALQNVVNTGHPVNPDQSLGLGDDEELLVEHLYTRLKDCRYMIVLDDVCDTNIWDYLRRSFPKQDNGSLLLLTTSLEKIALFSYSFHISRMPDFDEHPMWDFLCLVCRFKDDFNNSVPDDDRRAATFKIVAKMLNFSNHVEGIKLQMFSKRSKSRLAAFILYFGTYLTAKAVRCKFFLTLNVDVHNSVESIEAYRRLCIRNAVLFSLKDLQDSIMSISHDCNSVVMKWAEEMKAKHAWNVYGMPARKNQVTCSWDAGKKFK
ncbi:hypothetical protein SASPL_123923 [Salvia splendens]|uniref:NB-ARC domain-containing protein n=1 Tax=Salvia splendens TaxID=180675 RepID=A0A8X8XR77_SALSN|nr:hypothetical protein SASPL_123923 [Salvia splendens]